MAVIVSAGFSRLFCPMNLSLFGPLFCHADQSESPPGDSPPIRHVLIKADSTSTDNVGDVIIKGHPGQTFDTALYSGSHVPRPELSLLKFRLP